LLRYDEITIIDKRTCYDDTTRAGGDANADKIVVEVPYGLGHEGHRSSWVRGRHEANFGAPGRTWSKGHGSIENELRRWTETLDSGHTAVNCEPQRPTLAASTSERKPPVKAEHSEMRKISGLMVLAEELA
jgi:hypothetical protein